MAYRAFKRSRVALFAIAWFIGVYLVWLLISPITDRLSYVFYFYPSIGAVCIGIALGLVASQGYRPQSNWLKKLLPLLTPIYLLISLALFVAFCPGSLWWQIVAILLLYILVRYYADNGRQQMPQAN
jgi:Na+/alanine symporter